MPVDRRVAIVGVAESDLGITNSSIFELQTQAVTRALADAGLTLSDVDGLATNGVSRFSASSIGEYLGIHPTWTDSTMAGGSSYELFVGRAAEAIACGAAEVIVVSYGSNQRSAHTRRLGGVIESHTPEGIFEAPYGPLNPISFYAMAAQRHMHEFGTRPEQLAEVAVAARDWALLNPVAYRYGQGMLTTNEVVSSPVVSSPLRALDCCLVTDGGGALVLDDAGALQTTAASTCGHSRLRRAVESCRHEPGHGPDGYRRIGLRRSGFRRSGSEPRGHRRGRGVRLLHHHRLADPRGARILR